MKIPFYIRYVFILLGIILLMYFLYVGRPLFIPAYIGVLFTLLMMPFSDWLENKGIPRKIGAVISIILVLTVLGLFIYFVFNRINGFSNEYSQLQQELSSYRNDLKTSLEENLNVSSERTESFIQNLERSIFSYFSNFGSFASGLIIASVVLPMTMYFLMAYRTHYKKFLFRIYDEKYHNQIMEIYKNQRTIVRRYLLGILGVVIILAICNVTALSIIGIEHALLFGVLAGILNIVPIIGSLIGSLLPILYALLMKDSLWVPLIIGIYFIFIQLMESSVITPNIVGGRMKVNPFAIILAIFIGSTIWGPAGMVLFIPLVAQLKILCELVEPLQPYGFLLSDPEKINERSKTLRAVWRRIRKR